MIGAWMMKFLLVQYGALAFVLAAEGEYPKAAYWTGAFIITSSVLWMR